MNLYTKTIDMKTKVIYSYLPMKNNILILALAVFSTMLMTGSITCALWQHQCVLHHAAFYEADSWGVAHYKWTDTAYAHQPFQDDTWEKVQSKMFLDKIEKMGIH